MLTNKEVLAILKTRLGLDIAPSTLWRWVKAGTFPQPLQPVKRGWFRWREADIEAWITQFNKEETP